MLELHVFFLFSSSVAVDSHPVLSDEGSLMLDALGGCLIVLDDTFSVLYVTEHVDELLGYYQVNNHINGDTQSVIDCVNILY